MQMAGKQLAVAISQMHSVTMTIAEILAVCTFVAAHPIAIAIRKESLFPHIHKIIGVDIALMIIGSDAGTG